MIGSARAQMTLVAEITTIAGNGTPGYIGDNGAATSAELHGPNRIAIDSLGNLYIDDLSNNVIRKVAAGTGVITTVAGNGTAGASGNGGPATSAQLNVPNGVAVDGAGNIYIADKGNNVVRKVIAATGIIVNVAGNGTAGYSGDGGSANSAQLDAPAGIAVDPSGNLYIGDLFNNVVRKVTVATGIITTVAGNGTGGYSGDGGLATSAELFNPLGISLDGANNIYIADCLNSRIREVTVATGIITTVAGNGTWGYSGDGGPATSAAVQRPEDAVLDTSGNLYIADGFNNRIRKVNTAGIITTIGGNGTAGYTGDTGAATQAEVNGPHGIAVDTAGNLYIADTSNDVIREMQITNSFPATSIGSSSAVQNVFLQTTSSETISSITAPQSQGLVQEYVVGNISGCTVDGSTSNATGTVCTVPVTFTPAYPGQRLVPLQLVTGSGNINFGLAGLAAGSLAALTPGIIATTVGPSAGLNAPYALSFDSAGNLYIADSHNNVIRKQDAVTGNVSVLIDSSAGFNVPAGVTLDSAGNLYIADSLNNRIVELDAATGAISTLATVNLPTGVAINSLGTLYTPDAYNSVIWKINPATGTASIVAGQPQAGAAGGYSGDGGPAAQALFAGPYLLGSVNVDTAGNLYIADYGNNVIREVSAATGIITTIAGTRYQSGSCQYGGDGSAATNSSVFLCGPQSAVVDAAGDLYIADSLNSAIRKVSAATGLIGTVAGSTITGNGGDGGPATAAQLNRPADVKLDNAGNIFIADIAANVIRKIDISHSQLTFPTATAFDTPDATDNPQTATLQNIGNAGLIVSVPSSTTNPSLSANFAFDSASTCPRLTASNSAQTLAAGHSCTYAIDFSPTTTGSISGAAVITDHSAGVAPSTQNIALSATATAVNTTTPLVSAQNPSTYLNLVTFTASVSPVSGSAVPTGTLQFSVDGSNVGSAATLNGSSPLTYSTGTLSVGTHSISATYISNSSNYLGSTSSSLSQVVGKITPTLTWTAPSSIVYGTALSGTQLNAIASVPGTFAYSPAAGTILGAGSQTLNVTFTPSNAADYTTAASTTQLTVNPAQLTVTANNATRDYTFANPTLTSTTTGFVNGDTASVLSGAPTLTTTATVSSPVGTYPITAAIGTLASANYTFAFINGTLTVISGPDFAITVNPSTIALSPGNSLDVQITVSPQSGFSQAVALTCPTLPDNVTCSFAAPTVVPTGTAATTMLTITASSSTANNFPAVPPNSKALLLLQLAAAFGLVVFIGTLGGNSKIVKNVRFISAAAAFLLLLGSTWACGGLSQGFIPHAPIQVTVTATSGTLSHSANVQVTVQ